MSTLKRSFDNDLHAQTGFRAAWLPVLNSFELGSFGVMDGGVFVEVGRLSSRGVPFETVRSPSAPLSFQSAGVSEVKVQGGVEVKVHDVGAVDAELELRFTAGHSHYLRASDVVEEKIIDVDQLVDVVSRQAWWQPRYRLVNRVLRAESVLFLTSVSNGMVASVSGAVPALQQVSLGKVEAGVHVDIRGEAGLVVPGRGGVVGLGLVRRRPILGGAEFLDASKGPPVGAVIADDTNDDL